tara:strand:- start:273 stop:821 length:549 start_codon:yes stop_codon:yes gene_type:complete
MVEILNKFVKNPYDFENCFYLGYEYEKIKHCSSAISFYLKAAEGTNDTDLAYECLLRIAECYDTQGNREVHVISNLQWAISILPNRPEAYYKLSRIYEVSGNWKECMVYSRIGMGCYEAGKLLVHIDVKQYMLKFQYAYSLYSCGNFNKSLKMFKELSLDANVSSYFKKIINNNIISISNVE